MQAAGCVKIYREKRGEDGAARAGQAATSARAGRRADRDAAGPLARLARDLLNVLDAVAEAKAGFRSLKDTWADTTTPHGRLMLTVLGGLAEFEPRADPCPNRRGQKRRLDRRYS